MARVAAQKCSSQVLTVPQLGLSGQAKSAPIFLILHKLEN
jgi:hypothetical protein